MVSGAFWRVAVRRGLQPQLFAPARVWVLIDRQRAARDTWSASVRPALLAKGLHVICTNPHQGGSVTTRASPSADLIWIFGILRTAFCIVAFRRVPARNPRREATRQAGTGGPCINASCIFTAR